MTAPVGRTTHAEDPVVQRLSARFPDVPADTVRAIVAAARTQPIGEPGAAGTGTEQSLAGSVSTAADRLAASDTASGATPTPAPATTTPGRHASAEADLRDGLASLAQLALGKKGLPDMLTHIAEFAVRAIPGADGAGLTLFQNDRRDTIVSTDPFVQEVDAAQYELNEGPCITAAAEGVTIRSGSLSTDPAFPRFGPEADRLGVNSAMSLPLMNGGTALGTVNVYAHSLDAFDEMAVALGELFAVPASISVQNAQTLAQAQRLASRLQLALDTATDDVASAVDILLRPTAGGLTS